MSKVERFARNPEIFSTWTSEFFLDITARIKVV